MLKLIGGRPSDDFAPIGRPSLAGRLPDDFAEKLPVMMKKAGIPAIELTGGGEPTLWPRFDELVRNLKREGIEIGLVTNGSNLSNERIKLISESCIWVRFSMDASNQRLHKDIHRTGNFDFERRVKNIESLVSKRKAGLVIGISFVITPQNHEDLEQSVTFYKSIGVHNIRFSWMYDKQGKAGLDDTKITSVKSELKKLKNLYESGNFHIFFEAGRIESYSQANDFKKCYMQHFVWALGADCKIYPCCIIKYWPRREIGDLRTESLKDIIESQYAKKKMANLRPSECPPCWLGNRNKAIASAVEKPMHHNFV